ncbi:ATP-grasp fold amidoligase family protein [Pseudoalteromonas nigrifaciens]|uniref:ATP-grasp fold amidoligase family protein n=1 Tax=Pseudoalteromonas nigrifaciens TaxID=28109 RepID=UPI003FD4C6CA
MKKLISKLRKYKVFNDFFFYISFIRDNQYIPNFKNPKTYNEKINYRKRNADNNLFSICSDKLAVKDWVAEKGFSDIVIENYYAGDNIDFDTLKSILTDKGDVLLKANHNSGPVYLLTTLCSDDKIRAACVDVNKQLAIDYGKLTNESWYSNIKPQVLVEKRLKPESGEKDLKDYKFHVFKQKSGECKVILHIDFDRTTNHNRSYFDEELNWLPFFIEYPSIVTKIHKPKNYERMLKIVKKLALDFSYVRVDLYNIDGEIYFGELTFAPGSGVSVVSDQSYDKWMGNVWHGDPKD